LKSEQALLQIQKWLPKSNTEAEIAVGLAIESMKRHPKHAQLHIECFKCLRDLDHDTKIAISHAGMSIWSIEFVHHLSVTIR
jgi:hypothetical protein